MHIYKNVIQVSLLYIVRGKYFHNNLMKCLLYKQQIKLRFYQIKLRSQDTRYRYIFKWQLNVITISWVFSVHRDNAPRETRI